MNKLLSILILSLAILLPEAAQAIVIAGWGVPCRTCCGFSSPTGTGPCGLVNGFSTSEAMAGVEVPILASGSGSGGGAGFSLHYSSAMANGEAAVLSTVLGFGWTHSYNGFLFDQGGDLFSLGGGNRPMRFQRYGSRGSYQYRATRGNQQTLMHYGTYIEVTNNDALTQRYELIGGNPLRIQGITPWMLTRITDRQGNVTTLSYTGGLLTQVAESLNGRSGVRRLSFQYNANRRLAKVIDPIGRETLLSYDGRDNLIGVRDPALNTLAFDYDSLHQMVSRTDKNGGTWQYRYDGSLDPIALIDPAGKTVLSLSNDHTWQTDNTQLVLNRERVYVPAVTTLTDGNGKAWRYGYDANGLIGYRRTPNDPAHGDADGALTTYEYDPLTLNLTRQTDDNGHKTEYAYDSYGNLLRRTDNNGNATVYQYYPGSAFPALGGRLVDRLQQITYPNGSVTVYTYDARGNRLTEVRDQGGLNLTRAWTYAADGSVLTETDPNGHVTTSTYDDYGNLATVTVPVTDALGHTTEYRYTKTGVPEYPALSLRTLVIDGNNHRTAYAYDELDRRVQETDPLGYVTNHFYDAVGNRTAEQRQVALAPNPDWQLTTYAYDARYRRTRETVDPAGDPRNPHANPLNLVTASTYDGNDNRKTVTDPRNQVTAMDYDYQNRLAQVTDALNDLNQTRYDGVGNRVCAIDGNGHTTFYEYDGLDRLTSEARKMGAQSCTAGDSDDLITRTAYDSGTAIAAGTCKNPQCAGPIPGSKSPASRLDPEGKASYFKYDHINREVMSIRKQGAQADDFDTDDWSAITQYDPAGNVLFRTDANGNLRGYTYYDNDWLKTDTVDPGAAPAHLNEQTAYAYDGVGKPIQVTAPNGNVTVNTYDDRNQLKLVTDAVGKVATYAYDGIGNQTLHQTGENHTTRYGYDAANRLVTVTDPMNQTTGYDYDANGNQIQVRDRERHLGCYLYDALNRRTHVIQKMDATPSDPAPTPCPATVAQIIPSDIVTQTLYDAVGNVRFLVDSNTNATEYRYDDADRLLREIYADQTSRLFAYDKSGHLQSRTDQLENVTNYAYTDLYYLKDRDYRPKDRDYALAGETDDHYQYDVGGRMTRAERGAWVVSFDAYDAADRLLQTTQDAAGVPMVLRYAYNIPARTRTITYPGGRILSKTLDLRDRLDELSSGAFDGKYAYDLDNRVLTRGYLGTNGVVATYTYNPNDWIEILDHRKGATEIADFRHAYDAEGNKRYTAKSPASEANQSEAYAYDPIYRLVDYKVGDLVGSDVPVPTTQHEYTLDELGNWPSYKRNGVAYLTTPNQMNEYDDFSTDGPGDIPDDLHIPYNFGDLAATPAPDGENFAHDKNGNRREDAARSLKYDGENRLVEFTRKSKSNGNRTLYAYDALGRRVKKTVNVGLPAQFEIRYAHDDARIVEDQDAAGATLATYVHGNYIDEVLTMQRGAADFYYHQDTLWSVAAITDALGNVVERYNYTDYGCPDPAQSSIGNTYTYTGRQWDEESGLYYYRARYYDCDKGRFLQRDPAFNGTDIGAYTYASSRPTERADPSGLSPCTGLCSVTYTLYHQKKYGGPCEKTLKYRDELCKQTINQGNLFADLSCRLQNLFCPLCKCEFKDIKVEMVCKEWEEEIKLQNPAMVGLMLSDTIEAISHRNKKHQHEAREYTPLAVVKHWAHQNGCKVKAQGRCIAVWENSAPVIYDVPAR